MQPDDILRALRRIGDGIDVECRGVGRKHRSGSTHFVKFPENFFLDLEVLENRFDDEVGILEIRVIVGSLQATDTVDHFFCTDLAACDAPFVKVMNRRCAPL